MRQEYVGKINDKYKYKKIYLHKEINKTPPGMDTDHINRDKLDNRKKNLRSVSRSYNNTNSGLPKNNTSGHKGIVRQANLWMARITFNHKDIYLGHFKDIRDTVSARKRAELIYHII